MLGPKDGEPEAHSIRAGGWRPRSPRLFWRLETAQGASPSLWFCSVLSWAEHWGWSAQWEMMVRKGEWGSCCVLGGSSLLPWLTLLHWVRTCHLPSTLLMCSYHSTHSTWPGEVQILHLIVKTWSSEAVTWPSSQRQAGSRTVHWAGDLPPGIQGPRWVLLNLRWLTLHHPHGKMVTAQTAGGGEYQTADKSWVPALCVFILNSSAPGCRVCGDGSAWRGWWDQASGHLPGLTGWNAHSGVSSRLTGHFQVASGMRLISACSA